MTKEEHIKEIERIIVFNENAGKNGYANLPQVEKVSDYKVKVKNIDYQYYITRADSHYFVSRQLFVHFLGEYAYFSAHQCVENYLKGFLKYIGETPPNSHILKDLLKICTDKTTKTDFAFIHSEYIPIILKTYEPFYEFVRYPVQNVRPKDGIFCMFYPSGIEVLDYFVYKMKEILPQRKNHCDILKDGLQELQLCQMKSPNFYAKFKVNNINFK